MDLNSEDIFGHRWHGINLGSSILKVTEKRKGGVSDHWYLNSDLANNINMASRNSNIFNFLYGNVHKYDHDEHFLSPNETDYPKNPLLCLNIQSLTCSTHFIEIGAKSKSKLDILWWTFGYHQELSSCYLERWLKSMTLGEQYIWKILRKHLKANLDASFSVSNSVKSICVSGSKATLTPGGDIGVY